MKVIDREGLKVRNWKLQTRDQMSIVKNHRLEVTPILSMTGTDPVTLSHLTNSANHLAPFSSCRPIKFLDAST